MRYLFIVLLVSSIVKAEMSEMYEMDRDLDSAPWTVEVKDGAPVCVPPPASKVKRRVKRKPAKVETKIVEKEVIKYIEVPKVVTETVTVTETKQYKNHLYLLGGMGPYPHSLFDKYTTKVTFGIGYYPTIGAAYGRSISDRWQILGGIHSNLHWYAGAGYSF